MSEIFRVAIENSISGTKREAVVIAEDMETAILGAGVTREEHAEADRITAMDLGFKALSMNRTPKSMDLANFYESLVECLTIGTTMVESLEIVTLQQTSPLFRGVIGSMIQDMRRGLSMSESMAKFPNCFNNPTVAIIRAGETSGDLKSVLQALARSETRTSNIISRLRGSLTYPALVLFMTFASVLYISMTLVPAIAETYKSFDATLPLPTRMIIFFSDTVRNQPLFWVGVGGLIAYLLLNWKKITESEGFFRTALATPIVGSLFRKMMVSRIFRVLSMLISGGVRVGKAFEITAVAAGFGEFRRALEDSGKRVISGDELHVAFMRNQSIFGEDGPKVIAFMRLAAHTGSAGPILIKIAEAMENEIEEKSQVLQKLLEPILLATLSLVIGGVIFAVYYPLFNLGKVVLGD